MGEMKRAAWAAALVAALAGSADARNLESILQEKGVIDKGEAMEATAAKEGEAAASAPILPDWVNKIKPTGDVRVRNESFFKEDTATRIRQRFRLRFGIGAKVNSETELGFKIASGNPDDPISNNQTFDDTFTFKDISITNAFIKLNLAQTIGMDRPLLTLMGGKFDMPMYQPTKMHFDGDLTPEGFFEAIKLVEQSDGVLRGLALQFGQFVFEETSSRSDGALFAFQGVLNLNLAEGTFMNVGVGDFLYHKEGKIARKLQDNGELTVSNNIVLSDGSVVGGDPFDPADLEVEDGDPLEIVGFASDFNVFDVGTDLSIATGMPAFPLKPFGHYVVNTEANDDDTGFQLGVGVGNTKDPGDLFFSYAYQRLETDAVMSTFSDSDFLFDGGTNREGHILQLSYVPMKNLQFVSTAWLGEKIDGESDLEKRWQVDMIAKF
jgi:hypothetical protein